MEFDALPLLYSLASEYNEIISAADNCTVNKFITSIREDNVVAPLDDDDDDINFKC